ncbi:kynureninase [Glaciecola siphonariae]|uniref:Kynureninase n=1 Tax=Glaciecola siphonariae TaxID=521012 RepID=A0ABV9LUJ9_9ALTE
MTLPNRQSLAPNAENAITILTERAKECDAQDSLASLISEFSLPKDCIYLDGNSLGPLPIRAKQRAKEVVEQQWGEDLITSWNKHKWIDLPYKVGSKIAPLLRCESSQVIACDSISVNLTKVLCAALSMQQRTSPQRNLVISQRDNFPTDLYMVQGLGELLGAARCELLSVEQDAIYEVIETHGQQTAVLMLTHVNFRSGLVHDMRAITKAAHSKGILVVWDLAHSAGTLELALDECEVDFAVGCTYKYLNGGPGAPAFVYAAKRHWPHIQQPLSGWMGHKRPFDFCHDYQAGEGMASFLVGTPPVVSMSVLDAALDVFDGISSAKLRAKAQSLTQFFYEAFCALMPNTEFLMVSPQDASIRGSQLALAHPEAYAICQALIANNVIADFRAPNILRLGFSPLFLSHQDLLHAALRLKEIMDKKSYMDKVFQTKQAVT